MIGSDSQPSYEVVSSALPVAMLLQPGRGWRTPFCPYACDNGVYAAFQKGRGWDQEMHCQYLTMLNNLPADNPPLWVLLPDAVADWKATVELGRTYLPLLRLRGLNVALALQDGCDFDEVLDFAPDWVFVAGSTEWKLANIHRVAAFFQPLGIRVHVGRVNTAKRLRLCQSAGVDSADGTTLNKYRDATLPLVRDTLKQPCLII